MDQKFAGYDEAIKRYEANKSPRCKRLEGLESWVAGRQYDGKTNWWNDSVPLWERAPCIVYPVVDIAIQSNTDLLLGEGRFPQFTFKPGEDSELDDNGLSEVDSNKADKFLGEYHRLCKFKQHCRESFAAAQGCGTAVGIHGVRNGRPFADLMPAKWCEAKTDANGAVSELVISYPYLETYRKSTGEWAVRAMVYRRVIDAQNDTTFLPAEALDGNKEIVWVADPLKTYPHGFGFCPVVWYAHMRGCVAVNVVDGKAIHENFTDEVWSHDIALSQKHRGALMSEPQIVEIGVTPGYSPTDVGRKPLVGATEHGGPITANNPPRGAYMDTENTAPEARKKGPGYVWQYDNPETKVAILAYPDGALKAQDDNARDLRMKLMESLGVVLLDPESIKFAATTSGKALETIKQRQLDRCDTYRDDFVSGFLEPSIAMQLRIIQKLGAEQIKVAGIKQAAGLLAKFDTQSGWMPPAFQIRWGDYFKPDPEDQAKIVKMVIDARAAKVITLQIAVEKFAHIFGIDNPAAVVKLIEAEQLKAQEEAAELAASEGAQDSPTDEPTQDA